MSFTVGKELSEFCVLRIFSAVVQTEIGPADEVTCF
jgi:hypothetical protein